MNSLLTRIRLALHANSGERGASMVEYALLVILIAIVAFGTVQLFGGELSNTYVDIAAGFEPAAAN